MKKSLTVIACIMFIIPARRVSGEETLPYNVQAGLIANTLAYEKNVDQNTVQGSIIIGIVFAQDKRSRADARNLGAEFDKIRSKGIKVKDYAISYVLIPLGQGIGIKGELKAKNVGAIFLIAPAERVGPVVKATRELKILSITCRDVQRCLGKGIAVGLSTENGKPKILINTGSAAREGREFSTSFLTLARIVN